MADLYRRNVGPASRASDTEASASDRQLLHGVGAGSGEALAELYRRHGASVYGLARMLCLDDRAAVRVVEEVFVGVWRRGGRLEDAVEQVQLGLLAMALRRSPGRDGEPGAMSASRLPHAWLGELPIEHGQALALRMLAKAPLSQLALVLGVDRSTVAARLRHALTGVGQRVRSGHEPPAPS